MFAMRRTLTVALLVLAGTALSAQLARAQEPCRGPAIGPVEIDDDVGGRQVYLGFNGHMVPGWGMMVDWVRRGSPALRMGLEPGDVVVRVNGRRVCCYQHYLSALNCSGPVAEVTIDDCHGRGLVYRTCNVGGRTQRAAQYHDQY